MNINASIIDQRLTAVSEAIREQAETELRVKGDKLHSLAFVYLCVKTMLDLDDDEAFDCLTEGGGDFGVDAMHISEEHDGEFSISLFQAKYQRDLEGGANFPETGLAALTNAIRHIFDPAAELQHINERLKVKVEEARSLIRDGYIPQVRALACNNGLLWNPAGQETIERAGFGSQVTWEHVNHDRLIKILQAPKTVDDSLQLTGKALIEDMNYSRVLVGRISVREIAALIRRHGERLLERNIRRYLGLQGNRVNEGIRDTLRGDEAGNFYFFNNGITLTCDKFAYNALQSGDYQVRVENLQVINGGQTCMTIFKTLQESELFERESSAYVLLRLYQLPSDNEDLVRRITFATNSQNPVDLRDLRANDDRQQRLEMDIRQLGYSYRRKRTDSGLKATDITSGAAAEAILAVWKERPHQAKFFTREHFGKLYDDIFSDTLTGAQTIIAVLLYRVAENRRKRPEARDKPFVRYASCFIAMQMGKRLLRDMGIEKGGLDHKTFHMAKERIEEKGDAYFEAASGDVETALHGLYREQEVSLQQLSATFRRGDLIENLQKLDLRVG
ncbi:MAG TPA: AIPR family protein [Methylococcaceae bacterium]|nr:AIPR family protein [Methylococcaceae bacterium]